MGSLFIETGTERGVVAVLEGSELLYMAALPFGYQNSRFLVPKMEEGLKAAGILPAELDSIILGIGPGSYTGIRVGAAAAKTMSYAHSIPLVGVSTLRTFVPYEAGSFAVLIDAKISGAYYILGEYDGKRVEYFCEPAVEKLEPLKKQLSGVPMLISPNFAKIGPALQSLDSPDQWELVETAPDPVQAARLAAQKLQAGAYSTRGEAELIYLR